MAIVMEREMVGNVQRAAPDAEAKSVQANGTRLEMKEREAVLEHVLEEKIVLRECEHTFEILEKDRQAAETEKQKKEVEMLQQTLQRIMDMERAHIEALNRLIGEY